MSHVVETEDGTRVVCDCGRTWSEPWDDTCPECGATLAQVEPEATEPEAEPEKPKITVGDLANRIKKAATPKKAK